MSLTHIVQFSFGESSWYTARMVAREYGTGSLVLLFADTRTEDEDTYRWGRAAAKNVGGTLVEIADGRDIWEVFRDERFVGNSRIDPCSKILKRQLCDRWIRERFAPDECVRYVGIHWSEGERFARVRERCKPYVVRSPLCEPPLVPASEIRAAAVREGLGVQRLYRLGFLHANCGGGCVKAGQTQWAHLLRTMPERYAWHEAREEEMRALLGEDAHILTEQRGGVKRPLTLRRLRERVEAGGQTDLFDWGGCDCFGGD